MLTSEVSGVDVSCSKLNDAGLDGKCSDVELGDDLGATNRDASEARRDELGVDLWEQS